MNRIAIVGGPRCGKTSFALELYKELDLPLHCSDDLIGFFEWSELSDHIAVRMQTEDRWVWEGTAVVRALRKLINLTPNEIPCDKIYVFMRPYEILTREQAIMYKGIQTVCRDTLPVLKRKGIIIEDKSDWPTTKKI